jgi:hypothetical protein
MPGAKPAGQAKQAAFGQTGVRSRHTVGTYPVQIFGGPDGFRVATARPRHEKDCRAVPRFETRQ